LPKTVLATKFIYKLKLSARGLAFWLSGYVIPSLVLIGNASPEPKHLTRSALSEVISLHLLSTSYCVKGCFYCSKMTLDSASLMGSSFV